METSSWSAVFPLAHNAAPADSSQEPEFLEVLDDAGWPLLVMPAQCALKQQLPCKVALAALFDCAGKLYLRHNPQGRSRRPWDISAAALVRAGEAKADAAARCLAAELDVRDVDLRVLAVLPPQGAEEHTEATLFAAHLDRVFIAAGRMTCGGLFVDEEELRGLMAEAPQLLGGNLLRAWASGLLFA